MNDEIVEQKSVHFGTDLTVARVAGILYISMPSLCRGLELDLKGQLQRIKRDQSLCQGLRLILLTTQRGKHTSQTEVSCLQIEYLIEWLSGIRLSQIEKARKSKIHLYQQELTATIIAAFTMESVHTISKQRTSMEKADATSDREESFIETPAQILPISTIASLPTNITHEPDKMLTILNSLPSPEMTSTHYMASPQSQVDQSIREASFSTEDQWHWDDETEYPVFTSSTQLQVSIGTKAPIDVAIVQDKIREFSGSTTLTARIAMGLWNLRRQDSRLSINGAAGIRLDEILAWRGIQKHRRGSYPGSSHQRTDGYRPEHKRQILHDLELLSACTVRGHCTIMVKGKPTTMYVNGAYLNHSVVSQKTLWGKEEIVGIFLSPGDWITTNETYTNNYLTMIEREVFALNPQQEQHELRLALYLVERWSQQTDYLHDATPIQMEELLLKSMIKIPGATHLTRLAKRVEDALIVLAQRGIIGRPAQCVSEKPLRGKDWLASQWLIVPPDELIDRYSKEQQRRSITMPFYPQTNAATEE